MATTEREGYAERNVQRKVEAAAEEMRAVSQGVGNGGVTVPEIVLNRTGISEQIDDAVYLNMNHPDKDFS